MTWHAKRTGAYSPSSQDAIDNANEAANILINDYGWTREACAGMFGNINYEGQWNPWRWESDTVLSQSAARTSGNTHGYGLIGWTPARKYQFNNATYTYEGHTYRYFPDYNQEGYYGYGPNWSDVPGNVNDGAAQIKLIGEAMAHSNNSIWYHQSGSHPYNYTASQYIRLTDAREAALAWLWRAERPSSIFDPDTRPITERNRGNAAVDWMERLDWDYFDTDYLGCVVTILGKRRDKRRGY